MQSKENLEERKVTHTQCGKLAKPHVSEQWKTIIIVYEHYFYYLYTFTLCDTQKKLKTTKKLENSIKSPKSHTKSGKIYLLSKCLQVHSR